MRRAQGIRAFCPSCNALGLAQPLLVPLGEKLTEYGYEYTCARCQYGELHVERLKVIA